MLFDIVQVFNPFNIDEELRHLQLWPFKAVLHHAQEVGPPGQMAAFC